MLTVIANDLVVECDSVDTAAQFVRRYMDLSDGAAGDRPSIQCNLRIEGGRRPRPHVVEVPQLEAPKKSEKPKRGRKPKKEAKHSLEAVNRRELKKQRLDQIEAFLRSYGPAKKAEIARELGFPPVNMTGYAKDRRFKTLPDKRLTLAGDSKSTVATPAAREPRQERDPAALKMQIRNLLKQEQPQHATEIAAKLHAQVSQVVRALGDESTFEFIDGVYWLV